MALGALSPHAAAGQGAAATLANVDDRVRDRRVRRAAGSKRSVIRPRSPPRSRSISPSRPICRFSSTKSPARCEGRDCGRVRRARRAAGAPARIGAAARSDDRVGAHRRRAFLSRLVGSRSRPPRGLRAVRQPRDGGASLPGQVRQPRARFRRRPCRRADELDGGRERNRRAGRLAERSGPLFVKPNTLGAKIGIFADSLCRDRRRRTIGRGAYGSATATERSSNPSSRATTSASASWISAASSPISSASNGSSRTPRARPAAPF